MDYNRNDLQCSAVLCGFVLIGSINGGPRATNPLQLRAASFLERSGEFVDRLADFGKVAGGARIAGHRNATKHRFVAFFLMRPIVMTKATLAIAVALCLGVSTPALTQNAGVLDTIKRMDELQTGIGEMKAAAERGDVKAQTNLGLLYATGQGVAQDDAEAATWFRKAADQGNAEAQANLGRAYRNGEGVERDDAQAVAWYRKAADQGHVLAQANLGMMYARGRGVAQDDAQAVMWFRKAADQGDDDAQASLGWAYKNGLGGLAKDDAQAVAWYRKAAEQGNADAQEELRKMKASGSVR